MTLKTLYFFPETTLILINLSHGAKIDPKSPLFKISLSARGRGLIP